MSDIAPLFADMPPEIAADIAHCNFRVAVQALEEIAANTPHLIDSISLVEDAKALYRVISAERYKRMGMAL